MIKTMTPAELKAYRHDAYMRRREKNLEYQHNYYMAHQQEIKNKANNRYRKQCGLQEVNYDN